MINGSGLVSSCKKQLLTGSHHFGTDTFYIALYSDSAPLDLDLTTAYTTQGEISGTGYTAGGQALAGVQVLGPAAQTAYVTFNNPVWSGSTLVARGALIYNKTFANNAVAILDFGSNKYSNQGNFTVVFPSPGPTTALIRLV
jgi:hypothetical protein